jgi:hypothetical protein
VPLLFAVLTSFLAHGQTASERSPSAPPAQQAAPDAAPPVVGPDDPVITINGFCPDPVMQGSACKTVVTRAQFDKLADALQPDIPVPLRLRVANAYARNLRMAAVAQDRGLDKTPEFEEEMRFGRIQLLAQDLDRALKAEANNISDDDFAKYYENNKSSFEQATMARIFVLHSRQLAAGDNDAAQKKAAADAMTKIAADLRARAALGQDMDKLQFEAYAQAGIERPTADTKMEKVRGAMLPPQHESVMDLKPGEVSAVFSDPEGAHFIYKMISKEMLPLEAAKDEIRTAISTQRYRDSMKGFQGDVVFSDAYFNPPGKSPTPPVRGHKPRADNPPAQHN